MLKNKSLPCVMIMSVLLFLIFSCQYSYAQILAKIDEAEYDLDYSTDGYDTKTKRLASNVQISLKENWKIFAKNKTDEEIQIKISLENTENIDSFNIEWPLPAQLTNAFYFTEHLKIPMLITILNPLSNTKFDLNISIPVCNKTCSIKKHRLHVNIPTIENLGTENTNFIKILFIAFIGGIILNFMPCVLPVLSIKLLSIINCRDSKKKFIRNQFIATICGILFSFFILAILTYLLKISGEYIGLGLNFQQPEFITFLVLALVLFASTLTDRINFNLPVNLASYLAKHSNESKLFGSFLSGAFATLMATPCTAPFVGSAISFALLYNNFEIYSIFITIGLGMSLPYIILILNPNLIKILPKPGKWMITIKKILVIMVYLTILWLIFIISNLLDQKAAIILFMVCLLLQFIIENKQGILKSIIIKFILCILILITGFSLPKIINKNDLIIEQEVHSIWKKFDPIQLQKHIDNGNVVIVDVTADWCVTCKYNKFIVLDNNYMLSYYTKHKIITMRADYTATNKEINNFLASYNQRGIPFDVVYSKKYPHGIILPTILKTSDVLRAINKATTK